MLYGITDNKASTPFKRRRVESNVPPLPRSVQEHLGQKLRADYYERGDKPKYLGDPALPIEFDPYLYRLEQKERASRIMRIREHGATAVAAALSDLIG
jgi:hypothetical protein